MWGDTPPVYGPVNLQQAEDTYQGWDGIYAVFATRDGISYPIDVGESNDVGARLHNHDRKWEWFSRFWPWEPVRLDVFMTPTPIYDFIMDAKGYRMRIERSWRQQYQAQGYSLCGVRP